MLTDALLHNHSVVQNIYTSIIVGHILTSYNHPLSSNVTATPTADPLASLWARESHLCACPAGLVLMTVSLQVDDTMTVKAHGSASIGSMLSNDSQMAFKCHL